ncbi:uncharacterized protein LY89DRAFT_789124 [Mollisia scopiformis]|uniref:Uncharacterized protein n=1 Tax=Mollisia scopiformis TaxID=149040 RepID=A0A132B9G0_MOLSC|nr:uncharacterized protein LY89DRAFT_789124 [Mollisia scopiformis]KUJ08307.1 hypothetical protein LY89DRAFT_789124 [Mollisia scopiformis]
MGSPWSSLVASIGQQSRHESSNSNTGQNQDNSTTYDTNRAKAGFEQMRASQDPNLTTEQRIDAEMAALDTILSSKFSSENGFFLVKDIKRTRQLLTKSGHVVPDTHVRLNAARMVGQGHLRAVHLYAHPYKDLTIEDVMLCLIAEARAMEAKEEQGVFTAASLGFEVTFGQFDGTPVGHPSPPGS